MFKRVSEIYLKEKISLFNKCYVHLRNLLKWKQIKNKNTMETYRDYLLRKPVIFMHFWLNYCNENTHHIERIPVGAKNIDHILSN